MTDAMDWVARRCARCCSSNRWRRWIALGRGGIACAVAILSLGHGYFYDNRRGKKVAIALIVAVKICPLWNSYWIKLTPGEQH